MQEEQIVSKRVRTLTESATFAMSRIAKSLCDSGANVINLSIGEPDFKTPDFIREAAKQAIDSGDFFEYPPSSGYKDLREAIVKKFKTDNNIISSLDQIVVCNGAKQAIADAFFCLLNPGDEVIVFAPYWVSYKPMIEIAGGTPVIIKGDEKNNFKVSPKQLNDSITSKTKAIIFSSPCNPSGTVFNEQDLREISGVLKNNRHIVTISDEIYEHINFNNSHFSIGSIPEISDRVITINGFSKAYAMTGWRLGYMSAPKFIVDKISKLHGQISFGTSTISQRAGLAAITANKQKIQYMVDAYRERRDILLDKFKSLPKIYVSKPEGAFYLFPDISCFFGKSFKGKKINNADDFSNFILYNAHVALVSGKSFGCPKCVRISFASSKENLLEAFERLKEAVLKLQ